MKELFPHNQSAYEVVMQHFNSGNKRAAVVHATGTGKSYIIGAVTSHYAKCLVIAQNNFVLNETRKVCHEGVEFRTYASVMYDEAPSTYDLIVLDEFHRSGAEKWGAGVQRLLDANADAFVLGTSATHIRYLDNQRNMADEIFDGNVVSHLPLKEAIERNILPNPTYVSSIYTMDDTVRSYEKRIRSCRKNGVDKEDACRRLHGIARNWDNAGGVPAIIRKYFSYDMQRVIVFCSKVKRAAAARELLSKWFGMAGFNRVRYYNIDYKEKRLEGEMTDFQAPMGDYDLKVAISVNMLNEGVHIPRVDGVIMLRSTISRIIIEQQVGRCLTSDNQGRTPVVLDLVNNMDLISYDENPFFGIDKQGDGSRKDKEHASKGFPFKVIDECRDMRVLLEQLDAEIDSVPHTLEECMESASKFERRTDWMKGDRKLYSYASKHGWLDICCAHMTKLTNDYTKEECMESAKKFDSRQAWYNGDRKKCAYARSHGWYDECCAHMSYIKGCHSKEECVESALRFRTPQEWYKSDVALYCYARNHGWYDECIAHMDNVTKKEHITKEMCIESAKQFNTRKDWAAAYPKHYNAAKRKKWDVECCAHMELLWNGAGYTKEECMESASHYDTRNEWKKGAPKLYSYSRSHGWFEECCAHMTPVFKMHTKEECISSAKPFTTISDWRNAFPALYSYARSHGWYEECISHMDNNRRSYTKEQCMAASSKYRTRKEWEISDRSTFEYARRHGWYDECCAHMEKLTHKNK